MDTRTRRMIVTGLLIGLLILVVIAALVRAFSAVG
jgi:hypothetical protein